ncbi:MAG TPA: serine/threonine-protein kinase [Leptospiraceae bacterium]|nr:serine/threonine-protein kinase [Leptospiraceae bacterium]HMY30386.1 serine/threonine-protein kinase [Leptospiraceae bacterium]HMZ66828.1 serine/threonine-protein kinase [Leptospiraceae bacterium]HNA07081.1 serine/threonine-protein kinase [Leptospiraceae bacterium]HNC55030.1 serine/threonine-protein kinase [Leptospiraceae bacterium]
MDSNYHDLYRLKETTEITVYLAYSEKDQKKVILKILNPEYPTQEQVSIFHNEFDLTLDLNSKYIRKPIRKERINGKRVLVFEYINGKSLYDIYQDAKKIDLEKFITISIEIAKAISEIESLGIIHKDLNSNNILYAEDTNQITIIDFGIATKISSKSYYLGNPEKLEGTLSYISPEQTGRMNRAIDFRSDLYSLGISLYEILAGKLPFVFTDSLNIIHAHMAVKPVDLFEHINMSNLRFTKKYSNKAIE